MSLDTSTKMMLRRAKEQERKCAWLEAAATYDGALHFKSADSSFAAETWQRMGFCYARASTQSKELQEFKRLRQLAVEAYENGVKLLEKEDKLENQGKIAKCKATAAYLHSWLAHSPSEKKKILDESRAFGSKALEAFEKEKDKLGYGKTCNNQLSCLLECLYVASDASEMQIFAQEGIDYGNKAVSVLLKLKDKGELLLAYSLASLQNWYAANISEQEEKRKELASRGVSYSEKAVALSKIVDDPYYIAMALWAAALCTLFFTERIEYSLECAKEMLQQGILGRDNYIKGVASYLLAFITDWMVPREEDPEKKKEVYSKIIRYAEDAIGYLQSVSQDFYVAETYRFYAESFSSQANEFEASLGRKRILMKKAVEIGRKGLEHAVRSGSADAVGSTLHALSKTLHSCSKLEQRKDEQRKLLEEALHHRREYIKTAEKAFSSNGWILGVGKYYAGAIEAELARLETSDEEKKTVLENAVSDMKDGVSRCRKWVSARPSPSLIVTVAEFEDTFGGTLEELVLLAEDKKILNKAIDVYNDAAENFKRADLPSRVAESYWKMARNRDGLGNYQEAAENFEDASGQYELAAQKVHQFVDFYMDYAVYMKAWSEIEKARNSHAKKRYGQAKEHYEKAAEVHKSTKRWNHLSQNYLALATLEEAENLSRQEQIEKARNLFQQTVEMLKQARVSIKTGLEKIEDSEEKEMTLELGKASAIREEYCFGRIALEEAKILDRQGEHTASSGKFGLAAEMFQTIANKTGSDQSRSELQSIIYLCRAWQRMMMAEATASATMYAEAAELFKQAREHTSDQSTSLLALANSSFCKALEAGERFETTRDMAMYSMAKKHMETAANYYLKAGFKTASEYTIATRRLFDSYIYMENANGENDPEKKARYYMIAEKLLQTSAGSYMKAKHPEKAEQVHRLLEKVRDERKLAASLSEVLHAPAITASTASFATPTSNSEKAVGLKRFERASIQAHLSVPEEVAMEEDFEIQIDLVNVAKNFGLLVRIDNLVPKEFSVTEAPSKYDVEDGSIDLKGKRFDPLKVESIKLSARASDFGIFKMKPEVIYIDDSGRFQKCIPDAVHVKVQAPKRKVAEAKVEKKYELVYLDLLKERTPKNECRVAIAQIGLSKSGNILDELYEEKSPGLFGIREEKVETLRSKVRDMIEAAHAEEVAILLFPELTVDLNYNQLLEDIISLAKAYGMYIIPGSYHNFETRRNISVVVGPSGVLWRQEKHIPAIIHHEGKRFKEGIDVGTVPRKTMVCNTEFGRIAITICRDFLDMDLRVELKNFEPPVDLVFNPAFTPVTADFRAAHFDARRSIYAYCFFANVAEFGDSFIHTPEKERVERKIPPKEENLIYKDVDIFNLRSERKKWEKEQKRFIQSTRQ